MEIELAPKRGLIIGRRGLFLGAAALAVLPSFKAWAGNLSQTGVGLRDFSSTMTGSAVRVLGEDVNRIALLIMNTGANVTSFVFPAMGNTATPTITAGALGVLSLAAAPVAGAQGGSYEPAGGFIPLNSLWAKGTNADVLVCYAAQLSV